MPLLTRRRWLLLTDAECEALILALARGRHPESFTEADSETLLDWANGARWHANTLRQVLEGEVGVDVREEAPYFIEPDDGRRTLDAGSERPATSDPRPSSSTEADR